MSIAIILFWMRVQQQYPLLGPPSTRMAQALASGSCQCQLSALQLPLHLQELETAGLGTITWQWRSEQHGIACDRDKRNQTFTHGSAVKQSHRRLSLCFRSVSRASGSNNEPLQIISSTASRCFCFFFAYIWITCRSVNVLRLFHEGVSLKPRPLSLPDMLNKCKGDYLEVKDNRCKTQPSLLECLVYFVEVRLLIN